MKYKHINTPEGVAFTPAVAVYYHPQERFYQVIGAEVLERHFPVALHDDARLLARKYAATEELRIVEGSLGRDAPDT